MFRLRPLSIRTRAFATVSPSLIPGLPPPPPPPDFNKSVVESDGSGIPALIDRRVLLSARSRPHIPSIHEIISQYDKHDGRVLDVSLPYESRPPLRRRMDKEASKQNVVLVAHCVSFDEIHKVTLASGFAVNVQGREETLIVTCAHTLEEIRQSPLYKSSSATQSGSFVITGSTDALDIFPVSSVASSLPKSDLLLLSCALPRGTVNTLPVSPYPAHRDAEICAHFVAHHQPGDLHAWTPWIGDTWEKWQVGSVKGYRDFSGRETEPGTYDALNHLLFTPLPTPGSSGGPIIEKESGAVIGVVLGTRMDNRVEGARGWGVPSETIFEMFSLPGLEGKK